MESVDRLRGFAAIANASMSASAQAIVADLADAIEREAMEERTAAYNDGYDAGFASADDWAAQHEDAMAEHGWVRLPLDAEGVPIHVGDVMENIVCPPVHREVTGVGVECFYGWDEGNGRYSQFGANCYRHHHAPTVEDVLREFADRVCNSGHQWGLDAADTIAEYAAKLRLAEEVDG